METFRAILLVPIKLRLFGNPTEEQLKKAEEGMSKATAALEEMLKKHDGPFIFGEKPTIADF